MSCNNNCGCGIRGMNFQPLTTAAQDCFLMLKVAQNFSSQFNALQATLVIDTILDATVPPPTPYTFVSARSRAIQTYINSIVPVVTTAQTLFISLDVPPMTVYEYLATAVLEMELLFTDALGVQHRAYGHIDVEFTIKTTLTYEELTDSGIAVAFMTADALSGAFNSANGTFTVVLCGNVDLSFLCPALLRVKYEGECSFMSPANESLTVSAPAPNAV